MKQNFAKMPFLYYITNLKIHDLATLMQGRPSRRIARYGFVNNKQMAFLQKFVSQQLLFLFSKYLDTMSIRWICVSGQIDF